MVTYKFSGLLQKDGWVIPAFVSVDEQGKICSISNHSVEKEFIALNVFAIPGFQNAHSHAFQYAMAGLAERHSTGQTPDDFWSWRDAMYKLALQVNPDDVEVIASMLYSEMLRHGYTQVAEFHYVHHDQNGKPYDDIAEMGSRLISAAKKTGIGITMIPIFYQKGGFGKDPVEGQKRFISKDIESYLKLFEATEKCTQHYEHANVALGLHSLRGVDPVCVKEICLNGNKNLPLHIHISEQLKEVSDSLEYLGKRPVEWMLEHCEMDSRFHLVHATHINEIELNGIAKSGASVVLCPSTEGNLGDGIFPLRDFILQDGNWSIGTDSHIGLNPMEELRILDYGQRLISHKRNTFYKKTEGNSGKMAIDSITKNGRMAMNNSESEYFKTGDYLNAALFDGNHPIIASSSSENLLNTIVYAGDASMQKGVISYSKLIINQQISEERNKIHADFLSCIKRLGSR